MRKKKKNNASGNLSEEDVSRRETGGDIGATFPQGAENGPVDQLGQFCVVVLQHDGGGELLGMLA